MADRSRTRLALHATVRIALIFVMAFASCSGGSYHCVADVDQWKGCAARTEEACAPLDGCRADVGCEVASCPTLETSGCGRDFGCLATACRANANCKYYASCFPSGEGPCRQIEDETECRETEDCTWGPRCSGTLVHCADFSDDESACLARTHCQWDRVPGTFY
jgi:hypothetical protein